MREKRQKVNRVGSPSGTFIFLVLHESKTLEIWRKNSSRSTMIPLLCYLSIAPTLHRIRWREDASCRIGPKQCGKRRGGPSRAREVVTGVVRIMYNKVPTSASYIGTSWKMATTTTRFDTGTNRTMVARDTKLEKIRGSSKVLRHSCTVYSDGNNTKLKVHGNLCQFLSPRLRIILRSLAIFICCKSQEERDTCRAIDE